MVTTTSPLAQAWHAGHEGRPLPARLRDAFEDVLGADLSAVRVHTGPAADAAAHAYSAAALTCGSGVFFRDGAYRPDDPEGVRLLAHEVAHAVQQAGGVAAADQVWEERADRFADAFVAGASGSATDVASLPARPGVGRLRVAPGPSQTVQRHSSFEHRFLGEGPPDDLYQVATHGPRRADVLRQQIKLLDLFKSGNPRAVTRDQILAVNNKLEVLLLGPDQVPATLGEINALPDYLANPEQVDSTAWGVLLPILQLIRQEAYNRFTKFLTGVDPNVQFPLSPYKPTGLKLVDNIVETTNLDILTRGLGPAGQDHYQGLLARNACHFAPYSWHRWSVANIAARSTAAEYYRTKDPALRHKALNHAGYADHFLEDSFAAGHLIDKTLVMQWFVEWMRDSDLVSDHAVIQYMTAALQPGLSAGRQLYDPAYPGPSHDPQTVQEMGELALRVRNTRSGPGREQARLTGYLDYLTFLSSAVAQLASAELHDHYNGGSLIVASKAHPAQYRIWGDDSLFTGPDGGEGVLQTANTAELSRKAVYQILQNGGTDINAAQIRDFFPTSAIPPDGKTLVPLHDWATSQKPWVVDHIFKEFWDEIKDLAGRLVSPRLGVVSRDQVLGEQWYAAQGASVLDYQVAVLPDGARLFSASDGYAYQLDARTGVPTAGPVKLPNVGVDKTSSLALDADRVYTGISRRVHALPRHGAFDKVLWTSEELGGVDNLSPVKVLVAGNRVFAGTHGYVYELEPLTGRVKQWAEFGKFVGVYAVDLAADNNLLYVGTHGYCYALPLHEPWKPHSSHWSDPPHLGNRDIFQPVGVLAANGRVFAASNGHAYELSVATGKIVKQIKFADAGLSDYYAQLATDGGQLYIGSHGLAHAVPLNAPWGERPTWSTERLSVLYEHAPVAVLYLDDRLFVGCDGYAYQVDLLNGAVLRQTPLTTLLATGLDFDTALAASGTQIFGGLHGYAYGMELNDLQAAPTAAWPLVEPTGAKQVADRRGFHPAAATNVVFMPLSAVGGCAVFNGTNSWIETAGRVLDTSVGRAFSVQAWVRLDSLPLNSSYAVVSQLGYQVSSFSLEYSTANQGWVFERAAADVKQPVMNRVIARARPVPGVWTHVAGVYDPKPGEVSAEMRIYVDGTLQGVQGLPRSQAFDVATGALQIGAAKFGGVPTDWMHGAIRDVRVYDHALDDLRLEPQPTSFWRLAERSGTAVRDERHAHDAVATDVTWTSLDGIGGCATLNGSRGGIATREPVINCAPGGSFTVAAWARVDAIPVGAGTLIGQDGARASGFLLWFVPRGVHGAGNWNFARYSDASGTGLITVDSGVSTTPGTWTHVAGVYDVDTEQMTIYVDGIPRKSAGFPRAAAFAANGAFTIGYGQLKGVAADRLPGTVRDVRAYNQALSAEQVKNLLVSSS